MMMQGCQRPKCVKCESFALTNIAGLWLCGKCANDAIKRIRAAHEKMILEE